jgi:hypothetical protein
VPPVQALAALHGFWMVVAVAALVLVLGRLTPVQLRLLGAALTAAGVVGLLVFIGWDLTRWLGTVPPDFRRYSFQRILFAVGTSPDVPLVQVAAAGAVCWIVGILRKYRKDSAPTRARLGRGGSEGQDDGPAFGQAAAVK